MQQDMQQQTQCLDPVLTELSDFHDPWLAVWNVESPQPGKEPLRQSQETHCQTVEGAHMQEVKENPAPLSGSKNKPYWDTWIWFYVKGSFLEKLFLKIFTVMH